MEAAGNVAALALLGFVVKSILDYGAQLVSGQQQAEARPRGPLAPIATARDVLLGKKDIGMALTTALTPTPAARVAMDTLTNRDFAGRHIIEPAAPIQTKLKQAAEHIAGTIVSPYSTFSGTALPKRSKVAWYDELRTQLLDIKA